MHAFMFLVFAFFFPSTQRNISTVTVFSMIVLAAKLWKHRLDILYAILYKRAIFCDFLFVFQHGKQTLSFESRPLFRRGQNNFGRIVSLKKYRFPLTISASNFKRPLSSVFFLFQQTIIWKYVYM